MVDIFCMVCFVFMCVCGKAYGTESKPCPNDCACLGEYADCSRKSLTRIPSDVPAWIYQLNLNNNRIRLDRADLKGLPQLTDLKLNHNFIKHLHKGMFEKQDELKTLELNKNKLEVIEHLSFNSLKKLSYLTLKQNQIKQLKDGAFFGLENINSLELDWNHIPVISKAWIYGLNHLRKLSLSNNWISEIHTDVWELCKDLVYLNLSNNHIGSITTNMFKHLSKLEKLYLNDNDLTHIDEGAFLNTPELKILHLSKNKLSWTVEDVNGAFVGLNNLFKFHLISNNIKSINKNAFTELESVVELDLSNNNITTIQNDSFASLPHLKKLFLNTQALLCDCNLQSFAQWLHTNRLKSSEITVNCDYPIWLRGKSIMQLAPSNFTCDDLLKPSLIEEPKIKTTLKGDNITLYCKAVSSSPDPMSFIWKRDNGELKNDIATDSVLSSDGKHLEVSSRLQIFNISHDDQGKYQCIVSNSFGTTYSQKYRISVLIFPKFSKMPVNITVNKGKTAKLECAAYGEPQPQISWQKDGGNDFPAARERRMHVMPTDDAFFIVNVKTADMGIYSCTAHNLAGSVVANATLTVLEMPSFVKPMENKEITAGESIVLECMASGSPKPTLTWLKDGGPIRATDRHFFTAEDQLMIIVDTILSDSGTYECLMNNSLGSEHGSSELLVIPSIPMSDDDMMGIIIITVVCCAVGTSVVWVVIIYQTRKRVSTTNVSATTVLSETVDNRVYMDNSSDHLSCKDSGTGDSAKYSSVSDNFNLLSENNEQIKLTPMGQDAVTNNKYSQLQQTYPRSTNHDRERNRSQSGQNLIKVHITDKMV